MNLRRSGARQARAQSPLSIRWSRAEALSADVAMDQLFTLFPDHDPILLAEDSDAWIFGLAWPAHLLAHTDPALETCARKGYSLEPCELSAYLEVRRCGRADFVFSMFHSRALLAPALAAARRGGQLPRTVIHVDAHSDLGTPLLNSLGTGILVNTSFSVECRLDQPGTVEATIDAGLIHKGSFLAAYLLANPGGKLFHVWEEIATHAGFLTPSDSTVSVGGQTIARGTLVPCPKRRPGCWGYHKVAVLPTELTPDPGDGIWLDVDLDAFCNRFDGDSDRRDLRVSPEETRDVRRRVSDFLQQLRSAPWLDGVEAISVAASPGFFPAEHWAEIIPELCDGLAEVFRST